MNKSKILKKIINSNPYYSKGQVMVLSVIMLGGVVLSASAIAGLLMVYQIRQANDAVNSAKAIFAADAAIEWQTLEYYNPGSLNKLEFENDARATSSVNLTIPGRIIIRSQGFAGNVTRALEAVFSSTSTNP